jgi:hypothetical protein
MQISSKQANIVGACGILVACVAATHAVMERHAPMNYVYALVVALVATAAYFIVDRAATTSGASGRRGASSAWVVTAVFAVACFALAGLELHDISVKYFLEKR